MLESKEKYKILVMAILLAGACYLTYYFHVVRETGTIFTHYFYIPIILAALWWKRKGLVVAIFLAALIIFSHVFVREEVVAANDYFRALMFIAIAFVAATLSERIAKAHEKTAHLNAILSAIRNVNQLIVREKDRDRLIQRVCETLIETRGYYSAWIALMDENGRFLTAAEAGLGKSFSPAIEMMKHGEFTRCGQSTLKQSGVKVIEDVAADCADCPLVSTYSGRAGMAIRLEYRDRIYGILSVSIPVEIATDTDEQLLFNEVAGDIAFALHDMGLEEARKRAEESLRESEQWLSTTLRSIGDAVIVTDAKGLVTLMNPVAEDLTGWDEAEAVGKPLEDVFNIINEQTGERAEDPVARVLREGVVVGLANHTVLIAKDGTKRSIADSGAPMRDEEGNVIGTIMVFRDTPELKRMEEQLVRKEKLATIGQLASGVGHELRNPLGVIGNSTYYLNIKLKDADEKVRKHIEIQQREVNRANKIISDLLDFSRVRPPALEEGNVNSIIKGTLADFKLPENISVETHLNAELPRILVDPDQIRQVFLNLISNAVQVMPEGGRLDIKTGVKDDFAEIMLRDTGEGIPKEHLQKIFEPLFTKKAKGIGLGLSIVKGIVEGHKGKIEVESEVGEGTTFTIKLPLQRKEE